MLFAYSLSLSLSLVNIVFEIFIHILVCNCCIICCYRVFATLSEYATKNQDFTIA
jgi:hypothetical protein